LGLTPRNAVTVGNENPFEEEQAHVDLLKVVSNNGGAGVKRADHERVFTWKDYWLVPLFENGNGEERLMGFLGAGRNSLESPEKEHVEALLVLAHRATLALKDRQMQQQVFTSLEVLTPQVELIQRLRAAARYEGAEVLVAPDRLLEDKNLSKWVKDALTHYWGGPKLSQSPLLRLQVVQHALDTHEGNPTNALRAILHEAIEKVRPEGERRFTGEWILYNRLEMKFMEGRKVREIAMRLDMSEADLYRKQRVAIESVAKAVQEMERTAREEQNIKQKKRDLSTQSF
jgi:hypothetical protein